MLYAITVESFEKGLEIFSMRTPYQEHCIA